MRNLRQFFKQSLYSIVISASLFAPNIAGGEETAGTPIPSANQQSIDAIDHGSWDAMLKKYVDANGRVNYKGWHQSKADRNALQAYLNRLSTANPSLHATKDAKLAFWINAYNALTVEGILRVYPTTSIRNHTAKVWGYNIWKNLLLHVGSEKVSLEHIEHEILRKMDEPRIHFAIVCASIGCPRLLNEAYTADKVQEQLANNATDFFSRTQNLQVENGNLKVSQILDWFGSDFGKNQQQQMRAIYPYLPRNAKAAVDKGGFRVYYLSYDWDLNTQ